MLSKVGFAAVAALLLAATPALAQDAAKPAVPAGPQVSVNAGPGPKTFATPNEEADFAELKATMTDGATMGFAAIGKHRKKLEAALDRAPASYPKIETRDGAIYIHSDDMQDYIATAMLASLAAVKEGTAATTYQAPNVYPQISLLLGSYANENRDPKKALAYLDKGLAMQPNAPALVGERNAALVLQKKWPEIIKAADDALAANPLISGPLKGRLLRNKGFAFTELKDLDKADAAYRESLQAEPNNPTAKAELVYIAKLRGGQPTAPAQIFVAPAPPQPTPAPAPPSAPTSAPAGPTA